MAALAAEQADPPLDHDARERALAYLHLADRYADQLRPPTVIVLCGLMGSGKTTLAMALGDRLASEYIGTDAIRRDLLGTSPSPTAFNKDTTHPSSGSAFIAKCCTGQSSFCAGV